MVKVVTARFSVSTAKVTLASGPEPGISSRVGPGRLGAMVIVPSIPASGAVGVCPAEKQEEKIKRNGKTIWTVLIEIVEFAMGQGISLLNIISLKHAHRRNNYERKSALHQVYSNNFTIG